MVKVFLKKLSWGQACGVLQVKLCDPHMSALEVRFSRWGAIQIYVYLYLYKLFHKILYDASHVLSMLLPERHNELTYSLRNTYTSARQDAINESLYSITIILLYGSFLKIVISIYSLIIVFMRLVMFIKRIYYVMLYLYLWRNATMRFPFSATYLFFVSESGSWRVVLFTCCCFRIFVTLYWILKLLAVSKEL